MIIDIIDCVVVSNQIAMGREDLQRVYENTVSKPAKYAVSTLWYADLKLIVIS